MVVRRWLTRVAFGLMLFAVAGGCYAREDFPFDSELFLDAQPMAGSRRMPNIEIAANGAVAIELWCNRVTGQVVVAGDTITIALGSPTSRPCSPQQSQRDDELLVALNGVTGWRRDGDLLLLTGEKTLRFRAATH
jgi:heat shock protein HslJ